MVVVQGATVVEVRCCFGLGRTGVGRSVRLSFFVSDRSFPIQVAWDMGRKGHVLLCLMDSARLSVWSSAVVESTVCFMAAGKRSGCSKGSCLGNSSVSLGCWHCHLVDVQSRLHVAACWQCYKCANTCAHD
eukprot:47183-Pelagomonas_calceolata.AAC.1